MSRSTKQRGPPATSSGVHKSPCLLTKFPYPVLPGYITFYVVNC